MKDKCFNNIIEENCKDRKVVTVLNLAGGKFKPLFLSSHNYNCRTSVINLDRMYLDFDKVEDLLKDIKHGYLQNQDFDQVKEYFINHEIFDFLTKFQYNFPIITMYRYLEHVPKNDVLYFIYLLSTTVEIDGLVDVIVPNYKHLASMILNEDPFDINFESEDIITTFELLNEPYDPHASIWTEQRIYKFFELEGRFKIIKLESNYNFDGRDIYIRFLARRVK